MNANARLTREEAVMIDSDLTTGRWVKLIGGEGCHSVMFVYVVTFEPSVNFELEPQGLTTMIVKLVNVVTIRFITALFCGRAAWSQLCPLGGQPMGRASTVYLTAKMTMRAPS